MPKKNEESTLVMITEQVKEKQAFLRKDCQGMDFSIHLPSVKEKQMGANGYKIKTGIIIEND